MEAKKIEELTDAKRGSWAVSGVLAVVVLTVLVLSGRNVGAPVAWVQTAAASFRQGKSSAQCFALHFVNSSNVICTSPKSVMYRCCYMVQTLSNQIFISNWTM